MTPASSQNGRICQLAWALLVGDRKAVLFFNKKTDRYAKR